MELNLYILLFSFRNTVGGMTFLSGTSHPVSVQGNEHTNNSQYLKVRNFCALVVLKPINDHLVYSIFVNSAMTLMSLRYLVERTN